MLKDKAGRKVKRCRKTVDDKLKLRRNISKYLNFDVKEKRIWRESETDEHMKNFRIHDGRWEIGREITYCVQTGWRN